MKRLCALFLTLTMFLTLCWGVAYAAEPETETQEPGLLTDVLGALDSAYVGANFKLYVKPDKKAGLENKVKVHFNYTDAGGAVYLPGNAKATGLCFSWNDPDLILSKGGVKYKSGEAPIAPVGETVTYQASNGSAVTMLSIKTVRGSSNVGALFLTIDQTKGTIKAMNDDPNHDTECFGKARFDGKTKYISIKGRGNSTWVFPKKPYNITFFDDASYTSKDGVKMVKGVKAKKWSLVANHLDNSLMRNKIAMDLAEELGIGMKTRFMDVWMNGEYLGNYLVTPKNDYATPDGGYALENDNYVDTDSFKLPGMTELDDVPGVSLLGSGYFNRIALKDVGDTAKAKGVDLKTVKKHFLKAWAALEDYDSEEYQNYFDMDSWAKMFLMYEVSKTYDCYAGSLLMHRDGLSKSDKYIAGPAWDYDVSFGRTLHKFFVGVAEPVQVTAEGWYVDSIGLMADGRPISLLQELEKHKSFMRHVAKVYNENRAIFEGVAKNVDVQRAVLKDSALMNNVRWGTQNLNAEYVIAPNTMRAIGTGAYKLNYEYTVSWDAYVNNLREYCSKRVLWMSDHLAPGVEIVTNHGGHVAT